MKDITLARQIGHLRLAKYYKFMHMHAIPMTRATSHDGAAVGHLPLEFS